MIWAIFAIILVGGKGRAHIEISSFVFFVFEGWAWDDARMMDFGPGELPCGRMMVG